MLKVIGTLKTGVNKRQTPEDTDLEYIPLFDPEKPTSRQIFVSKE